MNIIQSVLMQMSWQVAAKGCVPEIGAHASLLKQDIVPPQTLLIAHSSPCDARLVHTSATARFLSCADSEDSLPGDSSGPSVENFDPSETRQSLKLLSKKPIQYLLTINEKLGESHQKSNSDHDYQSSTGKGQTLFTKHELVRRTTKTLSQHPSNNNEKIDLCCANAICTNNISANEICTHNISTSCQSDLSCARQSNNLCLNDNLGAPKGDAHGLSCNPTKIAILSSTKQQIEEGRQKDSSLSEVASQSNPFCEAASQSNPKRDSKASWQWNDNEESVFKFPYQNEYIESHSEELLHTMEVLDKVREQQQVGLPNTFINCDVRYFNWRLLVEEVGKFDVLLIDPPWRIKGAQQNDSQFMFSNCKFSLQYNTMGNSEIARIPLHLISDEGFIFLWILNSQLDSSVEIMQHWGYELVDKIVWVKLKDEKINLTHGYYFMHSYEICLVGYKHKSQGDLGKEEHFNKKQESNNHKHSENEPHGANLPAKDQLNGSLPSRESHQQQQQLPNVDTKGRMKIRRLAVSSNVLFSQVRNKSQKPQDLYSIIELMFQGKRKIQIFARNHNMKFGMFSIGNELGESYDKWLLNLHCDRCQACLPCGEPRFKSKFKPNYDLCGRCVDCEDRSAFFELANNVDENVRHQYVSCNHCGSEPIWGTRFQCMTCHNLDYDLCENCFDKNLQLQEKFHPVEHQFALLEVPVFGNGFHIHESKCAACFQSPIIGIYFDCTGCKNFKLCQKCFFERPSKHTSSSARQHRKEHQFKAVFESQVVADKHYQCFNCKSTIVDIAYMCENCFNFFFCQQCYDKRDLFKSFYANAHRSYHVFTKL